MLCSQSSYRNVNKFQVVFFQSLLVLNEMKLHCLFNRFFAHKALIGMLTNSSSLSSLAILFRLKLHFRHHLRTTTAKGAKNNKTTGNWARGRETRFRHKEHLGDFLYLVRINLGLWEFQ
ncbi:hypothetical protein VNO78_11643 [Psophocarpus tetragonolobus]|uniref:Uncharacterized protein n=1 Tax=Psophocarpus tetragonolobus TaxID=3891 RepID=A0AAN9XNX3_PSOTE